MFFLINFYSSSFELVLSLLPAFEEKLSKFNNLILALLTYFVNNLLIVIFYMYVL